MRKELGSADKISYNNITVASPVGDGGWETKTREKCEKS